MATNINKVYLTGNLTQEPELRTTQSGNSILTFNIAVNDVIKNSETQSYDDYVNYFNCSVFGNRANSLAEILKKGTKVSIDGKLRYSAWQDKGTGQNRNGVSIIVQNLDLMSKKVEDVSAPDEGNDSSLYDEDIPF